MAKKTMRGKAPVKAARPRVRRMADGGVMQEEPRPRPRPVTRPPPPDKPAPNDPAAVGHALGMGGLVNKLQRRKKALDDI